jgi:hypothetical protein
MLDVARPIQLNSADLYCTALFFSASSNAIVCEMMPSAVPSLGAARYSQFAAVNEPAPGMLEAMMVGLPGMCLPR